MNFHTIPLMGNNCFLLKGSEGLVLVDTARWRTESMFFRQMRKLGFQPTDIKLIVLTHAHFDHVAILKKIWEAAGRPPIAVHEKEKHLLSEGIVVIPSGSTPFGRVVSAFGQNVKRFMSIDIMEANLVLNDDEFDLRDYGIAGKVVSTPGHTDGSISVILENGHAFVGDLFVQTPVGSIFPPFADDVPQLLKSWEKVLQYGVKRIHVAHGKSFDVSRVAKTLQKFQAREKR